MNEKICPNCGKPFTSDYQHYPKEKDKKDKRDSYQCFRKPINLHGWLLE